MCKTSTSIVPFLQPQSLILSYPGLDFCLWNQSQVVFIVFSGHLREYKVKSVKTKLLKATCLRTPSLSLFASDPWMLEQIPQSKNQKSSMSQFPKWNVRHSGPCEGAGEHVGGGAWIFPWVPNLLGLFLQYPPPSSLRLFIFPISLLSATYKDRIEWGATQTI